MASWRPGRARRTAVLALGVGLGLGLLAQAALALDVGDPAPEFRLSRSDGGEVSLADFAGKRGFVLAWFPKAFTPG